MFNCRYQENLETHFKKAFYLVHDILYSVTTDDRKLLCSIFFNGM